MLTMVLCVKGWPGSSPGDVPLVHRLCVHAPHLGQVQQGLGGVHEGGAEKLLLKTNLKLCYLAVI